MANPLLESGGASGTAIPNVAWYNSVDKDLAKNDDNRTTENATNQRAFCPGNIRIRTLLSC